MNSINLNLAHQSIISQVLFLNFSDFVSTNTEPVFNKKAGRPPLFREPRLNISLFSCLREVFASILFLGMFYTFAHGMSLNIFLI